MIVCESLKDRWPILDNSSDCRLIEHFNTDIASTVHLRTKSCYSDAVKIALLLQITVMHSMAFEPKLPTNIA